MMTADGFKISGVVKEVTPEEVKMDFNHPLAGKDVRFKGKITLVRQATEEEIKPAQGCGCGCFRVAATTAAATPIRLAATRHADAGNNPLRNFPL